MINIPRFDLAERSGSKARLGDTIDFYLKCQGYKIEVLLLRVLRTRHSPGGRPNQDVKLPYEVV